MPASSSDEAGGPVRPALQIALAFASALAVAEAFDLELTFIAAVTAAGLAAAGAPRIGAALALPLITWLTIWLVVFLTELLGASAPLAFLVTIYAGLYAGYRLCLRAGAVGVLGTGTVIVFAIMPMLLLKQPQYAALAANDVGRNALVGGLIAWVVGVLVRAPGRAAAPPSAPPLAPGLAAMFTLIAAYLAWVYEPPAPGAALASLIVTFRAGAITGPTAAHDRLMAALVGGLAAVAAATLVALAHVLPMLFLASLALAWPFALGIARGGHTANIAANSLNVLAILTGEGFSPLFEDTAERLGVRIGGVLVGLAFAGLALALLSRRPEGHVVDDVTSG